MIELHDIYNRNEALEGLGRDEQLLQEISKIFSNSYHRNCQILKESIRDKKWDDCQEISHKIQGSLRIFCAKRAQKAAQHLECLCRDNEIEKIEQAYRDLLLELDRFKSILESI